MEKNLVTTVSNKKVPEESCRLIDKKYYFIGDNKIENSGDIYNINGRFIRFNTGRVVYNHTIGEYQLKNDKLTNGIIGFNEEVPIFGYFELHRLYSIQICLKNQEIHWGINEKVINYNYREERATGIFYHMSLKPAHVLNLIRNVERQYKESLPYDSHGILDNHIKKYNSEYNPIISKTVKTYASVIGDLTFGLEFETVRGIIPNNKLAILPLIPLRDGSIEGLEYVTIPLAGEKGIQGIIDSAKELSKRTEYNNTCSLHLHIGNIPRTQEFILAFYKLICHFQDEMFQLFPLYKKYNFNVKRKNYSKPFPLNIINSQLEPSINIKNVSQLNKNFKVLFDYLAEVVPFEAYNYDLNKVICHPLDERGQAKWNINTRYYAINLIPLIFGNKKTIEFRIHTPTYDTDKIMNFLFINSYLINFAKIHTSNILEDPKFIVNFKLVDFINNHIINNVKLKNGEKEELMDYHSSYIHVRKQEIERASSKGDIISDENNIKFHSFINWEGNNVNLDDLHGSFRYKAIRDDGMRGLDLGGIDLREAPLRRAKKPPLRKKMGLGSIENAPLPDAHREMFEHTKKAIEASMLFNSRSTGKRVYVDNSAFMDDNMIVKQMIDDEDIIQKQGE